MLIREWWETLTRLGPTVYTADSASGKDLNASHVGEEHGSTDGGAADSIFTLGEDVGNVASASLDGRVLSRVLGAASEGF